VFNGPVHRRGAHSAETVAPARPPLVGPLPALHQGLNWIDRVFPIRRLKSDAEFISLHNDKVVWKSAKEIGKAVSIPNDDICRQSLHPHRASLRPLPVNGLFDQFLGGRARELSAVDSLVKPGNDGA